MQEPLSVEFCTSHWNQLKVAIDQQGLWSLVSEGADDAGRKFQERADGSDPTVDNFDPLLEAWGMLMTHSLQIGAAIILSKGGCPLCIMNADHDERCDAPDCQGPAPFDEWVDFAAADALEMWQAIE